MSIAIEIAKQKHPTDTEAAFCELERIESLIARRKALAANRNAELKRRDDVDRQHNMLIADLERDCKHERTKWHGDPSGGSDSHRECLICGRTW